MENSFTSCFCFHLRRVLYALKIVITTPPRGAAAASLFALFLLAELQLAACYGVVSGSVSCLDCHGQSFNLSGIEMVVRCEKEKKLSVATTQEGGSFEAEVPAPEPSDCLVEIMGGTQKLYGLRNTTVSGIIKTGEDDSGKPYYTTATPLAVSGSCPEERNCSEGGGVGASKTFDFPLEWGLAPASQFFSFIPIIGIP